MRKIVVSEYVSLDGVMEDPGGAKSSSMAVGPIRISMMRSRNFNTMDCLAATRCSWDA